MRRWGWRGCRARGFRAGRCRGRQSSVPAHMSGDSQGAAAANLMVSCPLFGPSLRLMDAPDYSPNCWAWQSWAPCRMVPVAVTWQG